MPLLHTSDLQLMIGSDFLQQKGCTNMLKGYARASQANMTVPGYERIFCSNMMKINRDIFGDSLKETRIDLFMENSECFLIRQS